MRGSLPIHNEILPQKAPIGNPKFRNHEMVLQGPNNALQLTFKCPLDYINGHLVNKMIISNPNWNP